MSLLSLGQQIFDGARQLFDGLQKPNATGANDGLSETQKSAPVGFWSNLFGSKNTATPNFNNAGLNFTAQSVNLSGNEIEAQNSREAARFNPTAQVREWKEGVQADGTYISKISPSDLGKARWSKEIDPADISRVALEKTAIGTGIASNAEEAKQIVDNLKVNRLKTQTNKGERSVDKSDVGFAQWMKQRTDRQGRWAVQTPTDQIALLRDSARELKIGNPDVALALPIDATQQADAGAVLAGALALPKIAKELPKAAVLAGEAIPPLLIVTGGVLGAGALVHQHVGVVRSNWEDALKATRMPLPMNMDDAEPMPQPVPDGKPKERPYANPQAPTMPDVGTAPQAKPGELVKPETQAKPQTKVDDLPQPYTPDVPRATPPQSQPPKIDPSKVVPPIVGTVTAIAGKKAVDAVNNGNDTPGKYSTTIKWGVQNIEARPAGKGFWGKRIPQSNPRVDAYEQKINPNNESFYIAHPKGGHVQFENIEGNELQDGKLVMQVNNSIYQVYDKPEFLRNKVLAEAERQVEAAKHNGLEVEWLVSDEKTVEQLTRFFKEKGVDIKVTHFPE